MGQQDNTNRDYELQDHELMVCCVGVQSQVVYTNPVYQRVTGFSLQELQATQGADRIRDVPQPVLADLGAAVRQGKPWSGLIKLACKRGTLVWCRLNMAPLVSHGRYIGSLMVLSKPVHGEIASRPKHCIDVFALTMTESSDGSKGASCAAASLARPPAGFARLV
ncbi:PAS domain-containing protein [Paraburkholderia youngii]|uniref:PAS domain-containing protein n=1 Tax=Paraburkholderia youngii TaxID=2782701 RepID=UPI003D23253F